MNLQYSLAQDHRFYNLIFLRYPDHFLRFGINDQIFLKGIDLDYWFMGDSHRQDKKYFFDRIEMYNEYKPKKGKFIRICNWSRDEFIKINGKYVHRNGQLPLNLKYSKYYISASAGNPNFCVFNEDLAEGSLKSVASIAFEILQFAMYTGVKKLFLVGHDCDYSQGDYNNSNVGKELNAGYWISKYWKVVEPWIKNKYPDLNISWVDPKGVHLFNCISAQQAYKMMK